MKNVWLLSIVVVWTLAGCGVYSFKPSGESDYESLAIERLTNQTQEHELADQITDLIIDAFIADGSMKVVAPSSADAVLRGVFKSYSREPLAYDETDQVQSYRVTMGFEIMLTNPADDSEIWKETFSQYGVYEVATETEEDARQRAIDRLIEQIIQKTTKSW
ncbi:MAG: LptE family protein [bacterium]